MKRRDSEGRLGQPTARELSPAFWRELGGSDVPTTREKMIMLAVDLIVREGPADFNALRICEDLGLKAPTVNYHFGGRDGLFAEAAWWAYQMWTRQVDEAFRSAPANPRARLRAFVEGEVAWARRMGGMHLVINYPQISSRAGELVAEQHGDAMATFFEYHLALITATVRDIHRGTVHALDFDESSIPKAEFLLTPKYLLTATQISWATHGLATWSAGRHAPTRPLTSRSFGDITTAVAVKNMIATIIAMAEPS